MVTAVMGATEMGDIGIERREVEFEPIPQPVPQEPRPAEPEQVPK